ncbi:hypothetical protein QTO34_009915 [Cnephaeus nilssonii]|uniref:Uncharacterized protein n=1 Tax=Cnephaeus nilssonii TaxID=3371016 RepID=A0AA40LEZ5_CNENI|nr:hypothetical protein QTO34_009915 [Eptesicus nilssonii]
MGSCLLGPGLARWCPPVSDPCPLLPGPASRDYTVENSIRLGLAGVALLILVAILVEAGFSQRRAPQGPQE